MGLSLLGVLYPAILAAKLQPIIVMRKNTDGQAQHRPRRRRDHTFTLGKMPVQVLRGVDLEVASGEYLSIMGPSGSARARSST